MWTFHDFVSFCDIGYSIVCIQVNRLVFEKKWSSRLVLVMASLFNVLAFNYNEEIIIAVLRSNVSL